MLDALGVLLLVDMASESWLHMGGHAYVVADILLKSLNCDLGGYTFVVGKNLWKYTLVVGIDWLH